MDALLLKGTITISLTDAMYSSKQESSAQQLQF